MRKRANMAKRILTTHVGSLIRPPKFVDVLRAVERKETLPPGTYENALREAVTEIVRQQAEAGVDIVSDGEFGKAYNWAFYVHTRLSNIVTRPLTEQERVDEFATAGGGRDRKAFPEYYAEADKATKGLPDGSAIASSTRAGRSSISARRICSAISIISKRR